MSLRQKLLLLFSLTVAAAVAAVAYTVLLRIRDVFEEHDRQETALFVNQFQRAFQHRSADIEAAIQHLSAEERVRTMAAELAQTNDGSPYVTAAGSLAQDAQLDFLEIVGSDGKIVSSAQWPARFGYPEPAALQPAQHAFLKQEEMPDGSVQLGLFAMRDARGPGPAVHLVGGIRLNRDFLADLPVTEGMQIALYTPAAITGNGNAVTSAAVFDSTSLVTVSGPLPYGARYRSIIQSALTSGQQASNILYLTDRREDSVNATAIPLRNESGNVLAVLIVAISRAGMVQAQEHIRANAYGIAAAGILLAIVFSLWIAARVSRPIEQLASAAEDVAAGRWEVRVPERGRDEVSVLARSFNHMTEELVSQRERLVQSERVAAWRELARRLAHELKNPLFPLQLTVENMIRARKLSEAEFDEVFRESTATLGMEIANLKAIIGRFSDFSKMPQPELAQIDACDCIWRVALLHFPGLVRATSERGSDHAPEMCDMKIHCIVETDSEPLLIDADPELLHRALSNLALNAIDAMPEGGTLKLSAHRSEKQVEICVSDSGAGLTPEECERLFTPYYTTKEHGTGLGLAIVQSVVADHKGTISVESHNKVGDTGATFIIKLPRAEGDRA